MYFISEKESRLMDEGLHSSRTLTVPMAVLFAATPALEELKPHEEIPSEHIGKPSSASNVVVVVM